MRRRSLMKSNSADIRESFQQSPIFSQSDSIGDLIKQMRVLIVNDCVMQMKMLVYIVTKSIGISEQFVGQAFDGQQAIEKVKHNNYDVILMDLHMPIMDGFKASAIIKQQNSIPGPKPFIVALSAYVDESVKQKCKEHKIDSCYQSPLDVSMFKQEVLAPLSAAKQLILKPTPTFNPEETQNQNYVMTNKPNES